jgi:hypothetical protein
MSSGQHLAPASTMAPTVDEGRPYPREDAFDGVICFSHLRWDFVYQRPQHIMSRLASRYPVWFIEEPVVAEHDLRKQPTDCCASTCLKAPTFRSTVRTNSMLSPTV